MGFVSLYRKYRPVKFSDLVGQDRVVKTLKNSIAYDRIAHAYIFAGPRGTGKTSAAKVYARALNCESDEEIEPCGRCRNCRRIEAGQSMDVIEIDAASNRGIDEIRELREQVKYQPGEGLYRVYIIDEVHMLTDQAFNALLKTLEEPPENVVFILATTEPHKIISTVLSRCQRFDFTLLTETEIAERLAFICEEEEADYEREALEIIAYSSNGGMRDAISILDQAISYTAGAITAESVEEMLGRIDISSLSRLVRSIAAGEAAPALKLVESLQQRGRSVDRIVDDLLDYLRQIALTVSGGLELAAAGLSRSRRSQLQQDAGLFSQQEAGEVLKEMIELDSQLRYADRPDIVLESTLINLADNSRGDGDIEHKGESSEIGASSEEKEAGEEAGKAEAAGEKAEVEAESGGGDEAERSPDRESRETVRQEKKKDTARSSLPWERIMDRIQQEDVTIHAKLKECLTPRLEGERLVIRFPPDKSFHCRQVKNESQFIERMANEVMDGEIRTVIELQGDKECAARSEEEIGKADRSVPEPENQGYGEDLLEKFQRRLGGEIITVSPQALKNNKGGKKDGYEKDDAEGSADAEKDAEKAGGAGE